MNWPRLYIDEDAMGHGLLIALRARHVDVVTATEAGMINMSDEAHLRWATANSRVLYSFNIADYVRLHQSFVEREEMHGGIVLAPQKRFPIGEQARRLLRLMGTLSADQMRSRLEFLTSWSN
ncbi:MAG: DUF5615 family PIN-like protein [Bryobacteraceae bacterium]